MAASNLSVLTNSHRIVAFKKRAKKQEVKEVLFDEVARRDFLTGFHKRKVEKKEAAKKKALEKEKQERLEARREKRQMLAQKAAQNAEEVERAYGGRVSDDDASDEWDGFDSGKGKQRAEEKEEEYEDEEQLATVTVVEDFDPEVLLHGPPKSTSVHEENADGEGDEGEKVPSTRRTSASQSRAKTKSTPAKMHKAKTQSKVVKKAKDIKYQTNAARKVERAKQLKRRTEKAERAGGKATRKGKGGRGRR